LAATGLALAVILRALVTGRFAGEEVMVLALWTAIFLSYSGLLITAALSGLFGGIGLLLRSSWARIVLVISALLNAFSFPFGTAVAVYTLIVVLDDDVRRELAFA
jgi:hypothetical protein